MILTTAVIIDLIIAGVVVISVIVGVVQGLVRGLLTFVGMLLAFAAASEIANVASVIVVEQLVRPALITGIEQYVNGIRIEDLSGIEQLEQLEQFVVSIENDLLREQLQSLLSTVDIPFGELTRETLLEIGMGMADVLLGGAVTDIVSTVICILCFVLLSLLLRPVIWIVEQAFKLPLLRQINQLGGFVFGAARGVLVVLIGVWALRLTGWYVTDAVIADSYILRYAVQFLDLFGANGSSFV